MFCQTLRLEVLKILLQDLCPVLGGTKASVANAQKVGICLSKGSHVPIYC
jgi:hypothetical protein